MIGFFYCQILLLFTLFEKIVFTVLKVCGIINHRERSTEMKKYLIAFVALLLVATGCGNTKKLECSTEISGLHQDVIVEYDGEDIKSMEMIMSYDAATLLQACVDL